MPIIYTSEPRSGKTDKFVIAVISYSTKEEALVVQALLRANEVPASLDNYHHASNDWYIIQALGGIRVLVPAHTIEQCEELLGEHRQNAHTVLENVFGDMLPEKLPTRYKRAWSMACVFYGAPQLVIMIIALAMLYVVPDLMWGERAQEKNLPMTATSTDNIELIWYEPGEMPPPSPPPSLAQHYATLRAATLPAIDGFLVYVLLLSAFANFERPKQYGEVHDPSRRL